MAPRTSRKENDENVEEGTTVTVDGDAAPAAPAASEDEKPTNGNGNSFKPKRSESADAIPGKQRKTSQYSAWADEVEELRTGSLGKAFKYDDVPAVSGLAQGLRRIYGVNAVTRDIDTDKDSETQGYGTLWIEYPSKDENGTTVPDEQAVTEMKAKYSKS